MNLRADPALRRASSGAPWRTRMHTTLRWATAPMAATERELPATGSVLDVGCGHGLFSLYAALRSERRTVEGVDIDAAKLEHARSAAMMLDFGPERARFEQVPPGWSPPSNRRWSAVVIIDMLYLLGHQTALRLLSAAADAVEPGGRMIVKEMDTSKHLRLELSRLQELAATRVGLTEGATVAHLQLDDIAVQMSDHGLTVRRVELPNLHHVPHALLVGQRDPTN